MEAGSMVGEWCVEPSREAMAQAALSAQVKGGTGTGNHTLKPGDLAGF